MAANERTFDVVSRVARQSLKRNGFDLTTTTPRTARRRAQKEKHAEWVFGTMFFLTLGLTTLYVLGRSPLGIVILHHWRMKL